MFSLMVDFAGLPLSYLIPPDSLKDLVCLCTFYNLSSCNLLNIVAEFSKLVGDVYLPWVVKYLVEQASIELNLHRL